jgi:hypothetical protein
MKYIKIEIDLKDLPMEILVIGLILIVIIF